MNCSLYISNLPYTFDQNEFRRLFEAYGPIERLDIPDQHGSSKTIAYVHYFDDVTAAKAREGLDGQSFAGRTLSVQISNKKKKAHQPIQRNMSDQGGPDFNRRNTNIPEPPIMRPPMPMGPPGTLNFWDSDQYMSVPCKMIPVNTNTAGMQPANGNIPLTLTLPQFSKDGQTFGMATTIMSGDQQMDALVFLLPLQKKDPYAQPPNQNFAPPPPAYGNQQPNSFGFNAPPPPPPPGPSGFSNPQQGNNFQGFPQSQAPPQNSFNQQFNSQTDKPATSGSQPAQQPAATNPPTTPAGNTIPSWLLQ